MLRQKVGGGNAQKYESASFFLSMLSHVEVRRPEYINVRTFLDGAVVLRAYNV